MNASEKASVYEFSGFRLDAARRKLLSPESNRVPLTSRVFDTLLYLVQHHGELVEKAALMQAVWPDAVVEENNLNQAVTALRKALGEKRGEHNIIVTEPGRGYRFVAEVRSSPLTETEAAVKEAEILPNSIAVLPFDNLSPNPDDTYFAAGIHDEILNRLSGIKGLNVIARTSVLQYAGAARPITEIARELRVETIMEGTVRYANRRVRITTQLIDGRQGTEIWSRTYSHDLEDVFAIQSEIATAIAAALETGVKPTELARLDKPLTDSPAAYALFLKATDLMNGGDLAGSIALLDRAIELDPEFAQAYALKAYQGTWSLVNSNVAAPREPVTLHELERRALNEADHALEIDNNLGVAWLARAIVNNFSWYLDKAGDAFSRALELSPNDVNVLRECALFKCCIGEDDEAMRLAGRLLVLNPNDFLSYTRLILVADFTKRFEEALPVAQKAVELFPASPILVALLGYTHVGRGDYAAAGGLLRTAEQLMSDETGQYRVALIYIYGLLGLRDDAMRVFKQVQAWSRTHSVGAGDWAQAYLGIGELDAACDWLARAVDRVVRHEIDAGFLALILMKRNVHNDPVLEQPRFRALRERLDAIAMSE